MLEKCVLDPDTQCWFDGLSANARLCAGYALVSWDPIEVSAIGVVE